MLTRRKLQWILHSWMIWAQIPWMYSRLLWVSRKSLTLRSDDEDAEKIVTVGDAVEQIKNATEK